MIAKQEQGRRNGGPTKLRHAKKLGRTPYLPVVEQKQDGLQNLSHDYAKNAAAHRGADQREDRMVSFRPIDTIDLLLSRPKAACDP